MSAHQALAGLTVHHIGIAVHSIGDAVPTFELVTGARGSSIEEIPSQGVRVCFVGKLELLEPTGPESTVARFLDRRGPGLHHVAYACPDIRSELSRLSDAGFRLIDTEPRSGAHGHLVAFLHPASTAKVLIELVEEERA